MQVLLKCPHCKHVWWFTGSNRIGCTCPKHSCHKYVNINDNKITPRNPNIAGWTQAEKDEVKYMLKERAKDKPRIDGYRSYKKLSEM